MHRSDPGFSLRIALTCVLLVACALAVPADGSAKPASEYESEHEAMFCEGVDRGNNDDSRIPESQVRARYEGHYGKPDDTLRTWNIETICHDILFAVPLWADVSPLLLKPRANDQFVDYNGWTWAFEMGADGKAESVTYTDADGQATKMKRLGDPKSWD